MYFKNSTSPMYVSTKETESRTVPGSSFEQEQKLRASALEPKPNEMELIAEVVTGIDEK